MKSKRKFDKIRNIRIFDMRKKESVDFYFKIGANNIFTNRMKAIFGEENESKIISVFETTKDIICIENDNNDMMKIQITRKEDI